MNQAELKFDNEKKSVKIIFGDTTESPVYYSKKQAFKAITDYVNDKKIQVAEFEKMRDQILSTPDDKLPWTEKTAPKSIEIIVMGNGGPFGGFLGGPMFGGSTKGFSVLGEFFSDMMLASMFQEVFNEERYEAPKVDVPTFFPCNECEEKQKHGRIVIKTHYTKLFKSAKDGANALLEMKEKGLITDEEETVVIKQMQEYFDNPFKEKKQKETKK